MHSSLRSGRAARPIIVKGKAIITHLMRWQREQGKKSFFAACTLVGEIYHPACNHLNIYKWTQSVNIEAKSFSQQQGLCSWAPSLQFNECLCAQSYNTSLSRSFFCSIIVTAFPSLEFSDLAACYLQLDSC